MDRILRNALDESSTNSNGTRIKIKDQPDESSSASTTKANIPYLSKAKDEISANADARLTEDMEFELLQAQEPIPLEERLDRNRHPVPVLADPDVFHCLPEERKIIRAAFMQRWTQVELELKQHPELATAMDNDGYTLLHWTAYHGNLELCEYLLKLGANIRALNKNGYSAFQVAVVNNHVELAHTLQRYENSVYQMRHLSEEDKESLRRQRDKDSQLVAYINMEQSEGYRRLSVNKDIDEYSERFLVRVHPDLSDLVSTRSQSLPPIKETHRDRDRASDQSSVGWYPGPSS